MGVINQDELDAIGGDRVARALTRRVQAVATRSGMIGGTGPGATSFTDGTATSATYRVMHQVRADASAQDLVVRYANYRAELLFNSTSGEVDGPNPITIKAAIEYRGKVYPLRFYGQRSITIAPGCHVDSDALGVDLIAGETFYERVYVSVAAGQKWPVGFDRNAIVDDQCNINNGGADVVDALGTFTSSGSIRMFGAIGLWGTTSVLGSSSALIVGDSITAGVGDTNGMNGCNGYVKRAIGNSIGWIEHTRSGYQLRFWDDQYAGVQGGHVRGITLSRGANSVIFALGTNDVHANAWNQGLAQAQEFYTRAWKQLRNRGLKVFQTTITPQSTTTDGWVTTANQTASPYNGIRSQINDWIRTTPDGLAGYFEIADVVETARNSGIWRAGDTTDGTHPILAAHLRMAAAIDVSRL